MAKGKRKVKKTAVAKARKPAGVIKAFNLKIPGPLAKKLNVMAIEKSFKGPLWKFGLGIIKGAVT